MDLGASAVSFFSAIFHHRDTEAAQRHGENPKEVSAIGLSIKTAFSSPPIEVEASSHPAVQTDDIGLTGTGERTTQCVMATAKQATADGFNNAIIVPARGNRLGPDQP